MKAVQKPKVGTRIAFTIHKMMFPTLKKYACAKSPQRTAHFLTPS